MKLIRNPLQLLCLVAVFVSTWTLPVISAADPSDDDPYNLLPKPGSTRDTAGEPFLAKFSAQAAAEYLDLRPHNVEKTCFACHSSGAYMAARPLIDPMAAGVLETRVLMQRYAADFTSKPPLDKTLDPVTRAEQVLTIVELARHDAVTTGKLQPMTRKALDHVWAFQHDDGGFAWVLYEEAPQAFDHHWGTTLVAIGVGAAPDGYAQTEPAKTGIEKLRGWFRTNAPKDLHERGLTLIADAAVGGILNKEQREEHIAALFAKQLPVDGLSAGTGWSTGSLSIHPNWKRPDGLPLDSTRSDGYATGFAVYALARAGVPATDARLQRGIQWLKTNQRQTGGWYTFSPRMKDVLASYTGTSFAIQALSAVDELPLPTKITQEQFDAAYATADKLIAEGVTKPNSTDKASRDAKMSQGSAASAEATVLVDQAVAAIGGQEKLLKLFRIKEILSSGPDTNGNERQSVIEPPNYWWLGTQLRGTGSGEAERFLAWAWTLGALVDPKSKLEVIPDIAHEGKPAVGIRISETITPPMDCYFDRETMRLARILWRDDRHEFSDWKTVDGFSYPTQCVGYKIKSGKPWYKSELLELERLDELPPELQRTPAP